MALSLISLNINWDLQWPTVEPFLRTSGADVACLQEVYEADIPRLKETLGMGYVSFTPSMFIDTSRGRMIEGEAVFSKTPFEEEVHHGYSGVVGSSYLYSLDPDSWDKDKEGRSLSGGVVRKDGVVYRVLTTHLTWTEDGTPTETQLGAVRRMLDHLANEESFVLAGDFNAPRGRASFDLIASRYKDNIPAQYVTSMDPPRHRVAGTPAEKNLADKMVDGLFTTPEYEAKDVRLQFGVSDHAAIVAMIEKTA